jgi:NAD-dependent SIR2 family protein deacetylase
VVLALTDELDRVADLVGDGGVVVLSGAGLSTESGIPDYRGPSGASRRQHTPMTYQTFMGDDEARHRYWARSYLGWGLIRDARPNEGHRAVAALQHAGLLGGLITQNVDGLHQAAGARDVIELHGGLDRVICLNCSARSPRDLIDRLLREANPAFRANVSEVNPDGDVELPDSALASFTMIDCPVCGSGPLKPDVIFFGENVPRERAERCFDLLDDAGSLLVLGSSLTVMSGFRFVIRAAKLGIPVAIMNQGPCRADTHPKPLTVTARVDAPLGTALPQLVTHLGL